MNVITIESDAFAQIMGKLKSLEEKFVEMKYQAETPLSEKWLDNAELCQLLQISKRTLQSYRDDRLINYSQIGAKIYYRASDV